MRELSVLGSRVFVWRGVSAEVGENVRVIAGGSRVFLLTDRNCKKIAKIVELSLEQAGYATHLHVIPPGENQKSLKTAGKLYAQLLKEKADRSTILLTVGGGVVGDLGGFVASTFMRGIPLFHVPTTLLAQVDASIGGKTAVNLPEGKNLVGTFYQPRAIFSDVDTLHSLPKRDFIGGLAEAIKCAMVGDGELFSFLSQNSEAILRREPQPLEEILFRCASFKATIVAQDEKEAGLRAILNYGHTIGHGIEAAGEFQKFHHGEAVAIGLIAEAAIATSLSILSPEIASQQRALIELYGLPIRASGLSTKTVFEAMMRDKKTRDGRLRFALPEAMGRARFGVEAPEEIVQSALSAVLS
jgi:3-dehydroquinate synthase